MPISASSRLLKTVLSMSSLTTAAPSVWCTKDPFLKGILEGILADDCDECLFVAEKSGGYEGEEKGCGQEGGRRDRELHDARGLHQSGVMAPPEKTQEGDWGSGGATI